MYGLYCLVGAADPVSIATVRPVVVVSVDSLNDDKSTTAMTTSRRHHSHRLLPSLSVPQSHLVAYLSRICHSWHFVTLQYSIW